MEKILQTIERIRDLDYELMAAAQRRLDNLTKPLGSLGRLEELAKRVVGITKKEDPGISKKVIITMAGDHGVTEENVSAYPREVTPQMVYNFLQGGAGINVLARHVDARVIVVDMGVASTLELHPKLLHKKIDFGTKNIAKGEAMSREQAVDSINAGIEIVENEKEANGLGIIGTGDMGIGNTTPSSAIVAVFTGAPAERVTGKGTGIDDATFENKVRVIKKALEVNKPDPSDPIDVLSKVGGFEIGGLVGVILAGAANDIPIVIDGFISGAAALLAAALEPKVKGYLIASHNSVEAGHKICLGNMGLRPLFNLDMRLGEGTGAALGINLVEAGLKILTEMATFKDAGVSEAKSESRSTSHDRS